MESQPYGIRGQSSEMTMGNGIEWNLRKVLKYDFLI